MKKLSFPAGVMSARNGITDNDVTEKNPPTSGTYFPYLACLCISIMLISNITTAVPVIIGPIKTDGAFYLFPLAYVIEDVITEVYGFKAARNVIYTGFGVLVLAAICFHFSAWLPHGDHQEYAHAIDAYTTVAVAGIRFIIAGLCGYFCGELANITIMSSLKSRTGEHKLWLRLLIATVVSEFIDTAIFCIIAAPALGYRFPAEVLNYTLAGYIWKTIAEILVMPVTYWLCRYLKKEKEC